MFDTARVGSGIPIDESDQFFLRMYPPRLTTEQLKILSLTSEGESENRISRKLGVSQRTVRRRKTEACELIGVQTVIESVVWAVRRKLI